MMSAGAFHSIFPGMTLAQRQGVGVPANALTGKTGDALITKTNEILTAKAA